MARRADILLENFGPGTMDGMGVGFDVLWPQVAALTGWGVAILMLAIARSSKTTD